jgi:hypothetical protein
VAGRHERLAVQASPELRSLHVNMADLHRGIESRHQAAAALHTYHVERLKAWASNVTAGAGSPPRFIGAVAATLGSGHVGVSLLSDDRTEAVTIAADPVATAAQELEFEIGEGPAHEAATEVHPVVADESALPRRWPQFASAVAHLGIRSVASAPLTTGNGCLGALTVFEPADPHKLANVLSTLADALVHTALLIPPGTDPLALPLLAGADNRAVVHQASGMVAVQLGCEADDALAILRARAFAENKAVAEIAREVVQRELRLG